MTRRKGVFVIFLVVILIGVSSIGYFATIINRTNSGDTFLTSCSVTGVGGFGLRVVSDSTNSSVNGETISAVDRLGCNNEMQVVHLSDFSVGQGGWITPAFPSRATPAGELSFTVRYQGSTYNFSSSVAYLGSSCVTLHVPSGNVTTATVMNGEGSFCWQGTNSQ